ncbi:hypothetical protein [Roseobacter sp. TSBP12]|uniref:hypothetical protein n=1 Tax=Roseobacter sp. TSBP12 TaxID=1236613 RepID=UPI00125F26FB|nr:hypothetical protein [Roseobacter sp. TSBP12]KAB6715837.1 hypothetical protein C8029_12945 [Roseobacter sp. TSBP12]
MKNKLHDLNNHLFAQLERLADEDLDADAIAREVKRADAIVGLSDQVLSIANTGLKAAKLFAEHGEAVLPHLPQIGPQIGSKTE